MSLFRSRAVRPQVRVRSDLSQVTKRAAWEAPGLAFLAGQEARQKRGESIAVDPSINRTIRDMLAAAAPILAEQLERALVPVATNAFEQWPIATGLSKSLLALEYAVEGPTTFRASIVNRARYAWFINRSKTVRTLIFRPGETALIGAAEQIARGLGRV